MGRVAFWRSSSGGTVHEVATRGGSRGIGPGHVPGARTSGGRRVRSAARGDRDSANGRTRPLLEGTPESRADRGSATRAHRSFPQGNGEERRGGAPAGTRQPRTFHQL